MNTNLTSSSSFGAPALADAGEGFSAQPLTPNLARRQLRVSLAVICLMIVAAAVMMLSTGAPAPRHVSPFMAGMTVQQPQFVRPMTASTGETETRSHNGG